MWDAKLPHFLSWVIESSSYMSFHSIPFSIPACLTLQNFAYKQHAGKRSIQCTPLWEWQQMGNILNLLASLLGIKPERDSSPSLCILVGQKKYFTNIGIGWSGKVCDACIFNTKWLSVGIQDCLKKLWGQTFSPDQHYSYQLWFSGTEPAIFFPSQ